MKGVIRGQCLSLGLFERGTFPKIQFAHHPESIYQMQHILQCPSAKSKLTLFNFTPFIKLCTYKGRFVVRAVAMSRCPEAFRH